MGHGGQDPAGDLVGEVAVGAGQQNRELIATEPTGEVAVAQGGADAARDGHQQLVAGGVPEGVVDGLEPVQVHEQH